MNKNSILFIFLLVSIGTFFSVPVSANNLKEEIDNKTQELREIHSQIEETQKNLFETEQKSTDINQEIKRGNYLINQLDLTIKSHSITIDKLGLEINDLENNILSSEEAIALKSEAINKVLRELQIKDNEGLVVMLLKGQSLAESLAEIQNLTEIKTALTNDVSDLLALKETKTGQLSNVAVKKKGIEQEYQTSKVSKSLAEEQKIQNKELLALTSAQQEEYEKKIDALAARQAEIAKEIEDLEAELRKQINPDLIPEERPGVIGWPIEQGYKYITQSYGATAFARYAYKGKWHNGIDIGRSLGTPVLSAGEGIVVNVGDQDQYCRWGAYGKYIVIRHDNNLVTLYAHLSRQAVTPGDKVSRGDVIGYIGTTGYSTGPHLHFTVYDGNTFKMNSSVFCGPMPTGGDINPINYL
ncbi:MAG: peptidoglycan DD-metalloendopeptidase family protein [Patescibacteria group bacterium]